MSFISRIANSFRPNRTNSELDDELQFHIDQRTEELVGKGFPEREAERLARRRLGNPLRVRESSRGVKSVAWIESLVRDLGIGFRALNKHRISSLAAVASLALAIGACAAAFTLIDALVFRPLPLPAPEQLISLAHVMPAFFSPDNQPREVDSFSYPQYEFFRSSAGDDADLFAMILAGGLEPVAFEDAKGASENIRAESISGRGFEILGVKPAVGRLIQADDDAGSDGHAVAVLSYAFWKGRFGADPSVLGRRVTAGGKLFEIIGVAAASFSGVQPGYLTDIWLPLSMAVDAPRFADPDAGLISIWGRVHSGAVVAQLRERLQAVQTNFLRERARANPPRNLHGEQLRQFTDAPLHIGDGSTGRSSLFRAQFRRPLLILSLICGLLLLVACSNVANLLLARASARDSEMSLRLSLGAGRWRLVQQMLIESMQLAASAWVVAMLFAAVVAPVVVARLGPTEFPAWLDVAPNLRTAAFSVTLSLLAMLLFGIVPALRASSVAPVLGLAGPQRTGRIGSLRWMLAAQITFSMAVLFLSGLLLLSFRTLTTVHLGFNPDDVALFDLAKRDGQDHRPNTGAELLEHLRDLPAVGAASLSRPRPMGGDMVWIMTPIVRFPGHAKETIRPREVSVSPGFFSAMQIPLIGGRDFLPAEIAGQSPSVIVSRAFVDQFLPSRNPIGQEFDKLGDDPDPVRQRIVGVVADAFSNNLRESRRPTIYSPLRDTAGSTLNVRTAGAPARVVPALREDIEAAEPALTVRGSILLSSQIDNTLIPERLLALLGGFFSIVALLLVAVGLYGVINYSGVRRTREIGIRIALGAQRSEVVRLVVSDTSIPVIAGIVFGIAGGLGMARYLASQLFGIEPTDLASLTAPLIAILVTTSAAILPPALRAARTDPLATLRHE